MASMARCVGAAGMLSAALGQQVGPLGPEGHLRMAIEQCTTAGGCVTEDTQIVMDMNWRWLHNIDAYNNCLTDSWDPELCPDPETCAKKCALEGVAAEKYTSDYLATAIDKGIKLEFPKAPRVYMLDTEDKYKLFKLKNKEFTFDVDLSTLPCGMNAALYFVEMPEDGGKNELNPAGAKYGTGYCDAQCPHMKFIGGKANMLGWKKHSALTPELEEVMVGPEGKFGYCCAEMDILEANNAAGAYTAHPCKLEEPKVCQGKEECGDKDAGYTGVCDKDGCGFSSYRMGDEKFWGPGEDFTVDTSKPMTIVTQFITSDNTDAGDLVEIRRLYIQGGKLIKNSKAKALKHGGDSLTDSLCNDANKVFNATSNGFDKLGGLKAMGESLGRGMSMSMSIWDDDMGRMLWLDGEKGTIAEDMKDPGIQRGPCAFKYGNDTDMQAAAKETGSIYATFTNVRYGDLDTTYDAKTPEAQAKFEVMSDNAGATAAAAGSLRRHAPEAGSKVPRILAAASGALATMLVVGALVVLRRRGRGFAPLGAELVPSTDSCLE
mmetsp:Transcript_28224/g.81049  ORF Transcript_28224/g.81049 Transcript_28224/m.81049 type:complete len:547 (+) Transcript_28224:63-1703(+)